MATWDGAAHMEMLGHPTGTHTDAPQHEQSIQRHRRMLADMPAQAHVDTHGENKRHASQHKETHTHTPACRLTQAALQPSDLALGVTVRSKFGSTEKHILPGR